MKVAAVIPHWNRRDLLQTLLANLREQTRAFDEVIVADNGSQDDSAAVATQAGARVIYLEKNLGFAAAVNRGIAATEADWIAILNNDVNLEPQWLANLLAAAEKQAASFATGKTLMASDPSRIDGTFDTISRAGCAYRCGSGKPDGPLWNRARQIWIAPMTAALFRRSLLQEIGPLDERFESYLEDVDFGIRCALADRLGIYEPSAIAYHQGSSTFGQWNKYSVRLLARNQVLLTTKHFHGLSRWPIVAGQLLWGILALRHGCAGAYLRGKMSGMRAARFVARESASVNTEVVTKTEAFLRESERTILEIQQQTGFDHYWRAYFWLLGL